MASVLPARIVSLSNVIASTCQYEALKHVSFVVQLHGGIKYISHVLSSLSAAYHSVHHRMLGKSFKMMPVMLWGMAMSGKRLLEVL